MDVIDCFEEDTHTHTKQRLGYRGLGGGLADDGPAYSVLCVWVFGHVVCLFGQRKAVDVEGRHPFIPHFGKWRERR